MTEVGSNESVGSGGLPAATGEQEVNHPAATQDGGRQVKHDTAHGAGNRTQKK